jgi:uncharacterized Rmd1/YagE family protein
MKVQALHVGKRILPKTMMAELKLKPVIKDPMTLIYDEGKFVVVFKYGIVVFWGMNKSDKSKFLKTLKPYIKDPIRHSVEEEVNVQYPKSVNGIRNEKIFLTDLSVDRIALISLILGRSVALEYYENEVEKALTDFNPVMRSFEEKGKSPFSTKELLKRVGFAMNVRHFSMASMALLDRPDIAWEDPELDQFYDILSYEYEIDERYRVLNEKIDVLFKNTEFILTFIDSKKTIWLEATIVILIVIEILIFVYEVWFM